MTSLQYIIDSICSSVTVECVYKMIDGLVSQGPFTLNDLLPLIQTKDRSLDLGSAKMIATAALNDLKKKGVVNIDGMNIHSVK